MAGDERTFDQDPMLTFRLLADIALRALSPAVNDPATAVQALDGIEGLLGRSVRARAGPRQVTDAEGAVRLVVPLPGWEDFLRRLGVDRRPVRSGWGTPRSPRRATSASAARDRADTRSRCVPPEIPVPRGAFAA
ncbi:DUF2254 family protein [Streptomyces sp. NPDC091371]|uniref:DUF2254 family protein n=1 Tax=Streptomyces sp. NPDC091371 TaxID=3155303 RepID=UPI003434755E